MKIPSAINSAKAMTSAVGTAVVPPPIPTIGAIKLPEILEKNPSKADALPATFFCDCIASEKLVEAVIAREVSDNNNKAIKI